METRAWRPCFLFKTYKMKRFLIITTVACIVILSACKQKTESVTTPQQVPVKHSDSTDRINGCYQMVISKDTAVFELIKNEKHVEGKLNYKRFEKDSNQGAFHGALNDSTIVGWYRFQSEGMISVRQVVFKIRADGNLSEGYGKMEMKSDTAYFTLPHNLNFEDQHPYIKINCK